MPARIACAVAIAAAMTVVPAGAAVPLISIDATEVVSPRAGAAPPLAMVQSTADPTSFFVAEMDGIVSRYSHGATFAYVGPLLDITDRVATEYFGTNPGFGLFSLALHPEFATNGEVFVYYTAETLPYEVRLSRFSSADGGLTVDPDSEQVILSIPLDDPKHLGGHIAFGPDGFLYKDFGYGFAPENGQDPTNLWGTIIRIDIDGAAPYAIPPDNPFATGGGAPEVWAYGFRNPWRFSFDRETGVLWTGDVGEDAWEEIDVVTPGGNYGWPIVEGTHCYLADPCDTTGLTPPVYEYPHPPGSPFIVGGYVYRGTQIPGLAGNYVYMEGSGTKIRALFDDGTGTLVSQDLDSVGGSGRSFAEGIDGELFVLVSNGRIYRLDPDPSASDTDLDGVFDDTDNCQLVANEDQRDTNGDGFGNLCDPDLDDNGVVNFGDLAILKSRWLSSDADADFDGSGVVNFADLALLKAYFLKAPGP